MAASTLERRPLAAGFAALVGVAIVATVVLAVGLLTNANADPGATNQPSAIRSPSPTPSPSVDDSFPNAAEESLLAEIDPGISPLCNRAAESDYPTVALPGEKPTAIPVQAGLRCALGGSQPDVVFVLRVTPIFTGAVTTEFNFFKRVAQTKVQLGDCSKDVKAYMEWAFGLRSGKLLCTASPTRARIDWIFDGEDVVLWAERDDGDRAALYQWWLEVGRVILR